MGTNFYMKKKMTDIEKLEIYEKIDKCEYDDAISILQNYKEIHIGKRSAGWKFLWDAQNFQYFKPDKDSIIDWLKCGGTIFNEYGEEFTFDQFWDDEIRGFLDKGLDLESHYKEEEKNKRDYYIHTLKESERQGYLDSYGVYPNVYGEFYIGDLRFTTSVDFS